MSQRNRGYFLALIAVSIFALTLPITRFIVDAQSPGTVSAEFATAMRSVIAGLCSIVYLGWNQKLRFPRGMTKALAISAAGTVLGFPLFLNLGLTSATATQSAIVTGFLPMATAVMMGLYLGKRQSIAFWICAVLGFFLILAFSLIGGDGKLGLEDLFLLLAVLSASIGYVAGMSISQRLSASEAICWVVIVSMPVSVPLAVYYWPAHEVPVSVWAGLSYTGIFSMWLGFFAWYKGMLLAGAIAASQVQLLQPFMALGLSSLLLGEPLTLATVLFAGALIATLLISKRVSLAS